MVKIQVFALSLVCFLIAGCNNANVVVKGFNGLKSANVNASGANPMNASSFGAAVGPTAGGGAGAPFLLKARVSSVQVDPNTATAGGYHISAKVSH